jgi:hypothetical protein
MRKLIVWSLAAVSILAMLNGCAVAVDPGYGYRRGSYYHYYAPYRAYYYAPAPLARPPRY